MGIICIDEQVWNKLVRRVDELTRKAEDLCALFAPQDQERWLDAQDVCCRLHISMRTLQSYRERRVIPFTYIAGKYFYREGDIVGMLNRNTTR